MRILKDFNTFKNIYSVGGRKWTRTIEALERYNELKEDIYYSIGDSIIYMLTSSSDTSKGFIGNRRYFDVHYYIDGSEEIEFNDKSSLAVATPYSDETDRELLEGTGEKVTVKKGEVIILNNDKGYKFSPRKGLKKIIVKVTVEHNFFTNK